MTFEPELDPDLFDDEDCECAGECLCELEEYEFDGEELDDIDEEWEEEEE